LAHYVHQAFRTLDVQGSGFIRGELVLCVLQHLRPHYTYNKLQLLYEKVRTMLSHACLKDPSQVDPENTGVVNLDMFARIIQALNMRVRSPQPSVMSDLADFLRPLQQQLVGLRVRSQVPFAMYDEDRADLGCSVQYSTATSAEADSKHTFDSEQSTVTHGAHWMLILFVMSVCISAGNFLAVMYERIQISCWMMHSSVKGS
jgi:hypothetical protein